MHRLKGICNIMVIGCLLGILSAMAPGLVKGQSQDSMQNQEKQKLPSPKTALIKSAIIPGWGQFYNHRYLKAAGFFGVEAYMGYEFFHLNYKLKHITDSKIRHQVEYDRNTWGWRYLAVYLLCITDAFVDAHLAGFPKDNPVTFRMAPRRRGWVMDMSVTF